MATIHRSSGLLRLLAALALAGVTASTNAADTAPKNPAPTRAEQLEDLGVVRTQYLPKEMAYSPATRALAELQLAELERKAGTLSAVEFMVGLSQLGALTDNAHSGLRISDPKAQPDMRLPLHLLWLADALIVARAAGAAADLAGARVLRIEGRSPESLYAGAKVLLGGNEAARKQWMNDRIEVAGVLHALGLVKAPDKLALTLQLPNGQKVDRTVEMVRVAELAPTAELERLWSPEPIAGEHGWTTALGTDGLPLYLRDANRPFRMIALDGMRALYVQFRSNQDEEGFPIRTFVEEIRARIASTHPANLVLDLRFDTGGNLTTTLDLMREVPALAGTRTYLLVGPYTFSAGIISAAAIKKHGGDRVTIVGDHIGDRLHFWSEGARIELPNSHLSFRYTDGQFNLEDGCTGEPACMDDRYAINVNGVSLEPDIPAPLTAGAYFARRDPAMDAVAKDIAERSRKSTGSKEGARAR